MDIAEQVYETLLNTLETEHGVAWVEPVFVPGHPCYEVYCEMHRAYEQLRERLGVIDEEADAEKMIDCLLEHGKLLALEMFQYGRIYQRMLDEKQPGA